MVEFVWWFDTVWWSFSSIYRKQEGSIMNFLKFLLLKEQLKPTVLFLGKILFLCVVVNVSIKVFVFFGMPYNEKKINALLACSCALFLFYFLFSMRILWGKYKQKKSMTGME